MVNGETYTLTLKLRPRVKLKVFQVFLQRQQLRLRPLLQKLWKVKKINTVVIKQQVQFTIYTYNIHHLTGILAVFVSIPWMLFSPELMLD